MTAFSRRIPASIRAAGILPSLLDFNLLGAEMFPEL